MSKTITSEILAAYSQCPRKAFLLLCTNANGIPHEYTEICNKQRQINQNKYLDILQQQNTDVQPYNPDSLKDEHEFLLNATLETDRLAAGCAILNKVRTHSSLGRYSYEPTIFTSTNSINKEHQLELFFVSYVLEQVQGKRPVSGRIIGLDKKVHKVKLENEPKTLIPILDHLQEWGTDSSPEPPPLILNKHCSICQFQSLCRSQAKQEDNLSLLDGISTLKVVHKYEKKGLFTDNPKSDPDAEFIPRIHAQELIDRGLADMVVEKVVVEYLLSADLVKEIQIINGLERGNLQRALQGEHVGTIIYAD